MYGRQQKVLQENGIPGVLVLESGAAHEKRKPLTHSTAARFYRLEARAMCEPRRVAALPVPRVHKRVEARRPVPRLSSWLHRTSASTYPRSTNVPVVLDDALFAVRGLCMRSATLLMYVPTRVSFRWLLRALSPHPAYMYICP
ncbi:hypothetical protein MRX96_046020 [Rhipicephalus microplus]